MYLLSLSFVNLHLSLSRFPHFVYYLGVCLTGFPVIILFVNPFLLCNSADPIVRELCPIMAETHTLLFRYSYK